jgi:hypothetical protein
LQVEHDYRQSGWTRNAERVRSAVFGSRGQVMGFISRRTDEDRSHTSGALPTNMLSRRRRVLRLLRCFGLLILIGCGERDFVTYLDRRLEQDQASLQNALEMCLLEHGPSCFSVDFLRDGAYVKGLESSPFEWEVIACGDGRGVVRAVRVRGTVP